MLDFTTTVHTSLNPRTGLACTALDAWYCQMFKGITDLNPVGSLQNSSCQPRTSFAEDDEQIKVTARPELRHWVSALFGLKPAADCNLRRWFTTIQKECYLKGNDPIFCNSLRDVSLNSFFLRLFSLDIMKQIKKGQKIY